jgi:transcriptional regulator with PAS, ATPase and Fis domain
LIVTAERAGRKILGIRKRALDLLESYSWPGNIRELQNVIERSLIVCETDQFTIDNSWLSGGPMPTRSTYQALMEAPVPGERELIEAALAQTKGKYLDRRVRQPNSAFRHLLWNRRFDP